MINALLEDTGVCTVDAAVQRLNLSLEAADFQRLLCDNNTVRSFVQFPNPAWQDQVSQQLCNLTNPNAFNNTLLLLGALQRQFNISNLLNEV